MVAEYIKNCLYNQPVSAAACALNEKKKKRKKLSPVKMHFVMRCLREKKVERRKNTQKYCSQTSIHLSIIH